MTQAPGTCPSQAESPPAQRVRVVTGSRLHMGMFSFGRTDVRQFGGLGFMVDRPAIRLELALASNKSEHRASLAESPTDPQLSSDDPILQRALHTARRYLQAECLESQLGRIQLRLVDAPPQHAGLGLGTQLSLAVAQGLQWLFNLPRKPLDCLARTVGRGKRSAVGIHGFEQGGLLVEAGKLHDQEISPLIARLPLPDRWRFVLLTPPETPGLAGQAEIAAFAQLPPPPPALTDQLCRLALLEILPAVQTANVQRFGQAVDQFGQLAGQCFAPQQQGIYATPRVARLAQASRSAGACGVAQSSWGPTLVAVTSGQDHAQQLIENLQSAGAWDDVSMIVAAPRNRGASIDQIDVEEPGAV